MPKEMLSLEQVIEATERASSDPKNQKKQYFTTPEFAKLVGFHVHTLRYWDKTGKFRPHHKTPGGTRMYSLDQIKDLQDIYAADGVFNSPDNRKIKASVRGKKALTELLESQESQDNPETSPEDSLEDTPEIPPENNPEPEIIPTPEDTDPSAPAD